MYYYGIANYSHREEAFMSDTDKIIELRKLFATLPPHLKYIEWKRMERIIFEKKAIKVSTPRNPGREKTFNTINEVVEYLKKNGYPKASRSNVHKCLSGQRKKVYGHYVKYDD